MISPVVRAMTLGFGLAVSAASAASARTPYDGAWSISIFSERGGCDRLSRFGVQIIDGVISFRGPANLTGRVSSRGAVQVSVSAGARSAAGSGRLSRNTGNGRWTGRARAQVCSGYWTAARQ